jgi:hypothetical protein
VLAQAQSWAEEPREGDAIDKGIAACNNATLSRRMGYDDQVEQQGQDTSEVRYDDGKGICVSQALTIR